MSRPRLLCLILAGVFYPVWAWVLVRTWLYRPADWISGPHPWNAGLRELVLGGWILLGSVGTVVLLLFLRYSPARSVEQSEPRRSTLAECETDDEVLDWLSYRLSSVIPPALKDDPDAFVARLRTLPPGLGAMAATHELDVSITLDDLGWHFANWHHMELARETARGLRELEAVEAAELFEEALRIAVPYWDQIGALLQDDMTRFIGWYDGSELERALGPLNGRFQELCDRFPNRGLFHYRVRYARRYPERLEADVP